MYGNIIRTADALWYDVVLSGYTPSPFDDDGKVAKTSLGAEQSIEIRQFRNTQEALELCAQEKRMIIAAEIVEESSVSILNFMDSCHADAARDDESLHEWIAIVFGNEKTWVLAETLWYVDNIVHISMQGEKASLNVGQAAAIFMWELRKR